MASTERDIQDQFEEHGDETDARAELIAFLRERAGTDLGCVIEYGETERTVLFARETVPRDVVALVSTELELQRQRSGALADSSAAATRAVVTCYDEVTVVHVPTGDGDRIAIVLAGTATPRIRSFVTDCRDRLAEGDP